LHNNHHLAPGSARLSRHWWEFDIGWMYIRILGALAWPPAIQTRHELFGGQITGAHNAFVLRSKFFAFLNQSRLTLLLGFELGLFATLRHWS